VAYSNNPLVIRLFQERDFEVRQMPMYNRESLEGETIRHKMIHGETWEELLPDPAVQVIHEINGIRRIQQVSETDTNNQE
ncbi:MAG: nicotinate-nucleotide adenylyltransferase, partial [Halobacteriaceae archaeon]